jgi:uncharacterized membrane protein YhaH (DUF805 family)
VTPSLAVAATVYSLVAIALVGATLGARRHHDRRSMLVLFALYAFSYLVIIKAA